MPRKLYVTEGPKDLAIKAFHACTANGRIVGIFPVPIEYSEIMGLTEAREHANIFVNAACLHEAAKMAVGALVHGNGSDKSVHQAIRLLNDGINMEGPYS